jgi:hypothetical protein
MGGREFHLDDGGLSELPATAFFSFDDRSLKLEEIKVYPVEQGLTRQTLSDELLKHKEKLALVISRAINLPVFTDPRYHPDQWVFFCGKPGSDYFSGGLIDGDILIPFDLIQALSQSEVNDRLVDERANRLKALAALYPAEQVR